LFDCVLGGGYARGRVVNIVGDKSTGKTLLAIEAAANYAQQFPNDPIWYNEVESAFDPDYAGRLGLPLSRTTFVDGCFTVEDVFEDISKKIKENASGLYIIDSLDALSDRAEQKSDDPSAGFGVGKAKALSQMFRRLIQELEHTDITLFIISQIRDKIGVTFGTKYSRSGGRALDFYASQIVYLSQLGVLTRTISKVKRAIGVRIKAKCTKNKVGLPFREAEMPILFLYGIDDMSACLDWLEETAALSRIVQFGSTRKAIESTLASLTIDAEIAAAAAVIHEAVLTHWHEIETDFAPTRRKYAQSDAGADIQDSAEVVS
jgi:recombination protein RecA